MMSHVTKSADPHAAQPPRPGVVVLVSRCLIGEPCRFDGASRPSAVLSLLPLHWIRLDLCPEADLGMGVPRPPIGLLKEAGRILLVERNGPRDWTREMEAWCSFMANVLLEDGVAGAVLKSRSPSCGLGDAELFSSRALMSWPGPPEAVLSQDADGFWSQALLALDPGFPLIGDEQLADPRTRHAFVRAVEDRHRRRKLKGLGTPVSR